MTERVASDHPTVATVDAELARQGRTDRPKLVLPPGAAERLPAGEIVRVVLDGSEGWARVDGAVGGDGLELRGVYDTPDGAREPGSEPNRLTEWVDRAGLGPGRTAHLDVLSEGFRYGLRAPGERVVYETTDRPDESLAAIAERLDGPD